MYGQAIAERGMSTRGMKDERKEESLHGRTGRWGGARERGLPLALCAQVPTHASRALDTRASSSLVAATAFWKRRLRLLPCPLLRLEYSSQGISCR